jgi:F-type H+-transporting ATPase subunit b
MDQIVPKAPEVFYSLAAFLVLFIVLAKFAYPPILGMLEKREETIRESIEKSEETRVQAERLLEGYQKQLDEARGEAAQIVEQARKLGEDAKTKIEADAREEATKMLARAREEIASEKEKALIELKEKVADLSIGAAGRVVEKTLSAEDHQKLIEDYIAQVGTASEN